MSRTFKRGRNPILSVMRSNPIQELNHKYRSYKMHGPPVDQDVCPECRALTDYQSGFLICPECGWNESVLQNFDEMEECA